MQRWLTGAAASLLLGAGGVAAGQQAGRAAPDVAAESALALEPPSAAEPLEVFKLPGLTWLKGHGHDDPGVFRRQENTLHISGEGWGYWRTRREFQEFRLEVEYRFGRQVLRPGMARDSGIFLRSCGPDGNSHDGDGAFRAAVEVNVFEGATGDLLLIRGDDASGRLIAPEVEVESGEVDAEGWPHWRSGGPLTRLRAVGRVTRLGKDPGWEDREGFSSPGDVERPGAWNRLWLEIKDGRLRVRLNGRLVNEARILSPARGAVLFQCEGAEVTFRGARLWPLGDCPQPSAGEK